MNRRDFLARVTAALVGTTVVPKFFELVLPEVIPPRTPFPIPGSEKLFRISFPDGTVFSFQGQVMAMLQEESVDGEALVEVSVRPIGPMNVATEPTPPTPADAVPTEGTVLQMKDDGEFRLIAELQNIEIPRMMEPIDVRLHGDSTPTHVAGIRRMGDIILTGKFNA